MIQNSQKSPQKNTWIYYIIHVSKLSKFRHSSLHHKQSCPAKKKKQPRPKDKTQEGRGIPMLRKSWETPLKKPSKESPAKKSLKIGWNENRDQ